MTIATVRQTEPKLRISPRDLLDDNIELVSLPDIYQRVRAVADDPASSMSELSRVVSHDPALAARLLRLANSAFFGFSQRIDTVERAANLLGTRQIHDLVLATTVADAFSKMSPNTMTMHDFWRDSVHAAVFAQTLGNACGIADAGRFFVQGLLHNIGHLLLDQCVPEACAETFARACAEHRPVWLIERELIGCDYAEVGAALLAQWRFPRNLVDAVRYQNEPERAEHHPLDAAVVHASVVMLRAERAALDDTLAFLIVNVDAADILGLDEAIAAAVRAQAADALHAVFEVFFPQAGRGA